VLHTSEIPLAGKPPSVACVRTRPALVAMYAQWILSSVIRFWIPRPGGRSKNDSMRLNGHYIPRDHFCIHTQAPAAATQQSPTNGILDMNAQTAALIRHKNIAKAPMRMLAMD
jgi:hypothetical protein